MTNDPSFTSRCTRGIALSLGLLANTACGGSDAGTGATENGVSTGSGGAATSTGGSSNGSSGVTGATSTGGSVTSSAGATGTNTSGAPSTCTAGSAVQGGSDTCPNLPWRCVDETVGTPAVHLVGAECTPGNTGACCNYNDKCLTMTDGRAGSQSAVEVASGPCQAGCVVNPSAQACLDCINANLASSGKPALSAGCGTCFASLITCSATNCISQCLSSSTAPGCRECVFDNCTAGAGKYNECTGLLSNAGAQ